MGERRKVLTFILVVLVGVSLTLSARLAGASSLGSSAQQSTSTGSVNSSTSTGALPPVILFSPVQTSLEEEPFTVTLSRATHLTTCVSEADLKAQASSIEAGTAVITTSANVNLGDELARCGISEAAHCYTTGTSSPAPGDGAGGTMVASGAFSIQGWQLTGDGVVKGLKANSNVSSADLNDDLLSWLTTPTTPVRISTESPSKEAVAESGTASWVLTNEYTNIQTGQPYGQVHYMVDFLKLANDSNSSYDWWDVHVFTDSEAGIMLWPSESLYSTHYFWAKEEGLGTFRELLRWGPTTTNGSSSYSVNIGVTAGMDGSSFTVGNQWTKTVADVNVIDQTNPAICNAHWELDFQPDTGAATNTFTFEPGSQFRVPNGYSFNPSINVMGQFCIHHWWGWDTAPQNVQIGDTYVCVQ